MRTTIRFATAADAPTIHAFIRELASYEGEPGAVQVTVAALAEQMSEARPPFECLLVERDGEPAGFALFFQNYSTWRGRPGLHLEDLFVRPALRRLGLGRLLLSRLAALAVERGCPRLEWAVLDWNQPAIDFYRALGADPLSEWTTFRLTDHALGRAAAAFEPAPGGPAQSSPR